MGIIGFLIFISLIGYLSYCFGILVSKFERCMDKYLGENSDTETRDPLLV